MSRKFQQGFLRHVQFSPRMMRYLLNCWPPFIGAGITVTALSADFRSARVVLKRRALTRNLFGTQFGGSLFAMTDPLYPLLLLRNLSSDYVVWDKSATIHYQLPARGPITAEVQLSDARLQEILSKTADGAKYEPVFIIELKNQTGEVVATQERTLYIRRKPR